MMIELYGLPGSGKSTLARKLEREFGYIRIKIANRKELLWYNFLFFLKYPIKFFVLFYYVVINSSSSFTFYFKFMNTFLQHNAKFEKAKTFKKAVIDQGHFQNIISVFESELDLKILDRYIQFIPRPEKLVIFQADAVTIASRTSLRGYYAREGFMDRQHHERWRKIIEKNDVLFHAMAKKYFDDCIFLNSNNSIEDMCCVLSKTIAKNEKTF